MSTDPDTVRDNSGSLRNHRSSQGSSSQASLSERGSSGSPRLPANSPNNGSLARQSSPSSPFGTRSAATNSGTAPSGRPRQPSFSLHAAVTLNAAEHKDAITSLSPKERKSVSLGAAGAGLSSTDEITTLTTYFGFKTPNFASSAKNESAAMSPPIACSPRDTTQPAPRQNSSITFSPGTTPSMAPPPPPLASSPSSSLPKTPSQRRRGAIALNLMLADPTLPSPGELASSDRRASISSSGVAPAWGYAQRTGSIAGSIGSPASPVEFRTRSMSRSASMSRRGSLGASVIGNTIGNSGGEERHQRSMSRGDMHQEQEQEHERIVLRLFSRISALEAEVSRLRLSSSQRHARHRHRHRERTASPSVVTDTPVDSEVDMSAEEADIDTDSVSPAYNHSHPASLRASAAHPSTAPGVNVSTLYDHGKDRSPSQPITIPNPGSRPFTMNRAGSSTGSGLGLGLARTPSTGGNGPRPPPPTFDPHHLHTRSGGSVGSAGSWGVPSGPLGRSSLSARRSTSSSYSPPAPGIAGTTIHERPGEHGQGGSVASRRSGHVAAEDDTNFWTRSPTMTGSYPSQSPISMGMGTRGDEGVAYWQSEAGYLTRENQLLRRRNRELERQLAQFENRGNSDADNNEAPVRRLVYIPRQGQEQGQGVGRSRGTSISELQLGSSPMRGMQPSSLSQVTPLEDEEEMEVD
ncbi:hypothetical protein KEM56_003885 [Ascosphaera pollenicola]|nr:hypothetical protein KEM56_003885 [Ascosphaera pollenicola]